MDGKIDLKPDKLRYQTTPTCARCGGCELRNACDEAREPLRSYNGIRFTADGFDCALPISIDSHSRCSYDCLYCFAGNTVQRWHKTTQKLGQTRLSVLEGIFSGRPSQFNDIVRKALKYDRRNAAGYPSPVQLGAITDPCDNIERQQGWLLKFIDLAIKYRQPVRLSTKGVLLSEPDYLEKLSQAPELFWVAFSIISPDDEVVGLIDWKAPLPSQRIETMRALSKIGVKTSLRLRPILPGVTDRTKNHRYAYRDLIQMAADAGARAISYEVAFYPMLGKERWNKISEIIGFDIVKLYTSFGDRIVPCNRPSYVWTEGIMHAIYEEAKRWGMIIGVSDPAWKQLGETGCCCGILPDDPVFGNWQVESATNQLLIARDTGKEITFDDICPDWARVKSYQGIANPGTGPLVRYRAKHDVWADKLRQVWNDLEGDRGPLHYFQGALRPVRRDEKGDLVYRYVGLERQHKDAPYWHLD